MNDDTPLGLNKSTLSTIKTPSNNRISMKSADLNTPLGGNKLVPSTPLRTVTKQSNALFHTPFMKNTPYKPPKIKKSVIASDKSEYKVK